MADKVFNEESKYTKEVVGKVKNAHADLESSLNVVGSENLSRLQDLREAEYGPDFEMFLQQLHEKNEAVNLKDKFKRLDELKFLEDQPFFARIDLYTNKGASEEKFYIGKFGYTENKPIVTDWRARVASVYYRYRYPQKNVSYETPGGTETRDLKLKRTFEIEKGELTKYYNNDIQLDENDIIVDKIGKKTGGVLEDIVETIQQSQMDIIESDPRQVCVVQGCVGSGKSTVAIHKLAHIFFNFPTLIHSNKSIVIAKNQILVGYLSTLFPKLGIFDINYKTIREIIVNLTFREELGVQLNLDIAHNGLKDLSLDDLKKLNNKINESHAGVSKQLTDLFAIQEFEPFGGYKYSKNITPFENITDILNDLEEELTSQKEDLKELMDDSIRAYLCRENIKALRKIISKLNDIKNDLRKKTLISMAKEYKIDVTKPLPYNEALLFVFMYLSLVGIQKHPIYEYCVVDEGQDFSPLEYAILSKVVLRGRFAIFGDLNQSLDPTGIKTWKDLNEIIKEAKTAIEFELDTNYRSTKPIIDLAQKILSPYTKTYLPKSINRTGQEPVREVFKKSSDMISRFKEMLAEDIKDFNKSVGVIVYDTTVIGEIENFLKSKFTDDELIILNSKSRIHYLPKGIYLMNEKDCKGLEFSKVYVIGLNLDKLSSFEEARHAFVAATRAMNELAILGLE